ncbi:MAG: acyltransferase [Bacteroidales bacterium]|nr:acyltransferase [Bacteroidales bacterium]
MHREKDFEDIRPYYDEEINPALQRIVSVPEFGKILDFLFPVENKDQIIHDLTQTYSSLDFQKRFMHPLVNSILRKTSKGLTTSGFDLLDPGTPYLFVANHRDIVLDSAILQVVLLDHGHETSEITFGSNLMTNQFIIDLGKVNRMFKVYRGGNRMELFRNSQILSAYIRYTITQKKTSAWIAQRNGRTKDGNDKTETGLLKMFNFSGGCDFHQSFDELNIVPLVVSYEYEPCCAFKVRELMSVIKGIPYQKEPREDLVSIVTGITQQKGRIHLAAGPTMKQMLSETDGLPNVNDKINKLAALMDSAIYAHFRLWPTHYIAHDLLHQGNKFADQYTTAEVEEFRSYMHKELSVFTGDISQQEELLLKIYATPLINAGLTG